MTTASSPGRLVVDAFRAEFESLRKLAEKAVAQVGDEAFFRTLDSDANSVAVLLKHVGGNLRSRWSDIFTTDGEKPDRHRDGEFEATPDETRAAIMTRWQTGWTTVDHTLSGLSDADLGRSVTIRGEPLSLVRALTRSVGHTAGHVHQLIMLCRHWQGSEWKVLSIPRGQSETFGRPPRGV